MFHRLTHLRPTRIASNASPFTVFTTQSTYSRLWPGSPARSTPIRITENTWNTQITQDTLAYTPRARHLENAVGLRCTCRARPLGHLYVGKEY